MKCAVVYKSLELLEKVLSFLKIQGVSFELFSQPSSRLEEFDFIVSIGGDGTILSILQEVKKCPPIFGINTGRVGILTHSKPEDFETQLRRAIESFEVERFTRLSCICDSSEFLALNEVAFIGKERAKLIEVEIRVDFEEIDSLRCDGVIASTQIGSTAYAFSLGGPVIDPYLESIIITPIAPFRFGWRPYVFRGDRIVEFKSRKGIAVIDGKRFVETNKVTIKKSSFPAVFFKKEKRLKNLFYNIRRIE
ncbi:MAG: NAD(+)/NADH kinase [Archaeoglobaceae archaeon]|nr:NAD(+)/NADH kinase [Archaeoglobaceae archaeon]MDW7989212.1 NAD(+)/NADH kinase [Archaeoglobaceae archaeon]